MEFEDEDRDEELEEDDDDEDDEETTTTTMTLLTPPPYHHHHHNNNNNNNNNNNKLEFVKSTTAVSRYRECLKNHAVSIGGHAVDGCGEFMPAGPDGSLDGLKCAACGCHRNFHRKEQLQIPDTQQLTLYRPPPPPPPPPQVYQFYPTARPGFLHQAAAAAAAATAAVSAPEEQVTGGMMAMTMSNTTSSSGKKRHRTKFSQEQKDKMLGFAEQLGWKIQKCDETEVQRFCDETGVRRHVLKVWMHNNKHTLGKKPV